MSETKEESGKTIRSSRSMTLNLKRTVESGHVRQNFSHGRSKSVLVEKKKKRSIAAPGKDEAREEEAARAGAEPVSEAAAADSDAAGQRTGVVLRALSDEEKDARARALAEAREREAEDRHDAVEAAQRVVLDEEQKKREQIDADERQRQEEARLKAEEDSRLKAEETARSRLDEEKAPQGVAAKEERPADDRPKKDKAAIRRGEERRVRGKLTITNALDEEQRQRSLASLRRRQERQKKQTADPSEAQGKISREAIVPEAITIQELANRMAERAVDVIKYLMTQGDMRKMNDVIDADTAELIAQEFGHTIKRVSDADVEEGFIGDEDKGEDLQARPPIVTVMGHVDHGKTSLLDAIRKTNVVSGEAGGITQHIGAYQVDVSGHKVTFIDTPGHEAFTAMRARGAKVTDIVVLVVAADDGVMPQTVEAITHAREAGVPIIVAVNKIDKRGADPNKVRTELLQHEIVVESMSGDVLEVEVSATERTNLDKLLEAILLQAELLELKANPDRPAEGVIIEAKLEQGRGPVGTMLVQRGTLRVGDIVVAGGAWGKTRALIDDQGNQVDEAAPAVPVEVLGFSSAPDAGDQFAVVESEARAREITEYRQRKRRDLHAAGPGARGSLEHMMGQLKDTGLKEFPLLIKGDVQGSVEAIVASLKKLGTEEVQARVIHAGVGGITESDVNLAATAGAVVIGFNVRANKQARSAADDEGIEIRYYAVIYDLVDDVKAAMSGLLDPTLRETFLGNAEILEVFNISNVGKIAGCRVTEGRVERGANVRLIRDDVVMHEGKLGTLKRFKDEVSSVQAGQECGMGFEKYQDMREGDVIECFNVEEVERSL
jgi:translation initiation factor IF-2